MLELITSLIPVIFASNLVLSGIKYLSLVKESKWWLRGALVVVSALGLIAHGVLTGNEIDFNQVSDLFKGLAELIAVSLAAHVNYKLIKTA